MSTKRKRDNARHPAHSEVWEIPPSLLPNRAAELWGDLSVKQTDSTCDDSTSKPHLSSTEARPASATPYEWRPR